MRLGLCCLFMAEPIRFRQTTAAALLRLPRPAQLARLSEICLHNSLSLQAALQTCARLGIGAFRILSPLLPRITHPAVGYRMEDLPAAADILAALQQAGAFARSRDLRLSFHPDQYILLNSPQPEVVRRSIEELDYQAMVAQWVGAEVINLHAGGVYGDRPAALARLRAAVEQLAAPIRSRLTLENDDRSYAPADLVPLCRELEVPFVYDVHHHRCLADGWSIEAATAAAVASWRGREPWFHLSSPRGGWQGGGIRAHADYIDPADFPVAWRGLKVTVDVEAKAKELAVLRLRDWLSPAPARPPRPA